jgi:hypothetical protein
MDDAMRHERRVHSLGNVLGLMSCKRSSENGQVHRLHDGAAFSPSGCLWPSLGFVENSWKQVRRRCSCGGRLTGYRSAQESQDGEDREGQHVLPVSELDIPTEGRAVKLPRLLQFPILHAGQRGGPSVAGKDAMPVPRSFGTAGIGVRLLACQQPQGAGSAAGEIARFACAMPSPRERDRCEDTYETRKSPHLENQVVVLGVEAIFQELRAH